MATNLLWFVMAGFLLGFATSTLWEWFYFRKERLKVTDRRVRELEAKIRDAEADADSISSTTTIPTVASVTGGATRTSAWGDASYRSPGVFLETEEAGVDSGENALGGRDHARTPITSAPPSPVTSSTLTSPTVASPTGPTVNSVTSAVTPPTNPPSGSPPLASSALGASGVFSSSVVSPSSSMSAPNVAPMPPAPDAAPRSETPTPADALRAKRTTPARSRQEVLAALRRNSEAQQRGEMPRPESETSLSEMPPFVPRRDTLVTPIAPVDQEPSPVVQAILPAPEVAKAPEPTISPARQRWANNPELTQRTQEHPDDLSRIKGIGDVYKQRLYRAGVYTWKQIAEADTEMLRRATSAYPSSNVDEWLVQAQKLMEKYGRANAIYSGPQPDDMTKILGIGPVSASTLYRAGVCTYEQLASTAIADLEALFPVAVAGDQPDFKAWVARAAALADEKHADK